MLGSDKQNPPVFFNRVGFYYDKTINLDSFNGRYRLSVHFEHGRGFDVFLDRT
jgi:hypothetical protein